MSSDLHQAALDYAAAGIPVFPVGPNKKPLCLHGQDEATTDETQINQWWTDWPDANIATIPGLSGWCVIDTDPPDGETNWQAICAGRPMVPNTYMVRSPRGGLHRYYDGSLPPTAGKLAPHVDTRGEHSYVLLPPSATQDGAYTVECDADPAPVPEWIAPLLASLKRTVVEAPPDVQLDLPFNINRANRHLAVKAPLVDGHGSDEGAFVLACELRELGISRDTALDMLHTWQPEFDDEWWEEKVNNAYRYGQNGAGAFASAPTLDAFAAYAGSRGLVAGGDTGVEEPENRKSRAEKSSRFHFDTEAEQELTKDPTWQVKTLIPDAATVLLLGQTGSFKSFLAQDLALAIASGVASFGSAPVRPGPVFYAAHEGRPAIKKVRRQAWKQARGVDAVPDFYVGRAPVIADDAQSRAFMDEINAVANGRRPGLIVLDTVAKCMVGLNENNAADAGRFVAFCDDLRDTFNCPVIAIHHTGKEAEKGGRGSSAFQAGFDTTLQMDDLTKEARKWSRCCSVTVVQHKDAEEPADPWFFQGRPVGRSLAFFPITQHEYKIAVAKGDRFSQPAIASALRVMGALGLDKAVTTHVLALHLTPPIEDETIGELNSRIAQARTQLTRLAKGDLHGFSAKTDKDLMWFLPATLNECS